MPKPPARVSVKRSVERCYIHVEGCDFPCPLCCQLVKSGYEHECEKDGGVRTVRTRPKAKR